MVSEKALIKNRAQKYLSRGNYKKALGEFQKIVQLDPTNLRALLKVGDLLHKLKRADEAVAQYKQVARQYVEEGFLIQAISLNKIILRIDPSQEGIDKELADLYTQIGASSQIPVEGQTAERKLPEIPLFSALNRRELHEMISHLKAKRVAKENLICKEGDHGDSIYIISSGKVGVLKYSRRKQGDILLATLHEGDFFGEISLIFNRPRMASVRTTKTTELLELEKQDFDDVVGAYPSIRGTLDAFSRKRMEVTSQMISSFSSSSWAKKATAAMV